MDGGDKVEVAPQGQPEIKDMTMDLNKTYLKSDEGVSSEGELDESTNKKSKLCLKLDLNISSSSNLAASTSKMHQDFQEVEPVNVTVEYPDDIQVIVSARVFKMDGNEASGSKVKVIKTKNTQTNSIQTSKKISVHHKTRRSSIMGKPRASQSVSGAQHANNPEKVKALNCYKDKSSSGEDTLEIRALRKSSEGEGEGDSIYESVLVGNDSLFGNISAIDCPSALDMLSTNANAGSMEDFDADCPDGIYPILSDTDEVAELNLDDGRGDDGGSFGFSYNQDKDVPRNDYDVTKIDEIGDDYEVKKILAELLDKVESLSEGEEILLQKSGVQVQRKSRGNNIKLSSSLPMKIRQSVTTNPVAYSYHKQRLDTVAEESPLKTKKKSNNKNNHAQLITMEKTRAEVQTSDCFKSDAELNKENEIFINQKFNWSSTSREPCDHAKSTHACHVCFPLPEDAIILLEDSIGLTSSEAKKAAFIVLRYLKEQQNTNKVKTLMKYIASGLDVTNNKHSRRAQITQPTQQPVVYTKEQKLLAAIRTVSRQKGAWGIFEDDEVVIAHLDELNQYLTTLDKNAIRRSLREDRYQSVKALTVYFALEKRWLVRYELLNTLEILAVTDSTAHAVLISSDLPVDLAESIRQEYLENSGGQERIFSYGMALLSLIGSGSRLQVDHLTRIDVSFVYCLLQITEGEMKDGCPTKLKDVAVHLILAYNGQFGFTQLYTSPVIAALSAFKDADYLKQKMVLLVLNKEVSQFLSQKHSSPPRYCHLVVKFATDILTCNQTSDFFIDADLNILLAGVSAIIDEYEPGDENRTITLRLARLILRRLDYQHNGLRLVLKSLKGILSEKEPESHRDQKIARKMAREIEESRSSRLTQF